MRLISPGSRATAANGTPICAWEWGGCGIKGLFNAPFAWLSVRWSRLEQALPTTREMGTIRRRVGSSWMWQQQGWRNMTSAWGGSNGRRAQKWQCPSPDWLSRPPMGSPTMSCSVLAIATIIVWSPMCSMRLRSIFSPRFPSHWVARASRWAMGRMCGRVISTISKLTTGRTNLSLATRADCDY